MKRFIHLSNFYYLYYTPAPEHKWKNYNKNPFHEIFPTHNQHDTLHEIPMSRARVSDHFEWGKIYIKILLYDPRWTGGVYNVRIEYTTMMTTIFVYFVRKGQRIEYIIIYPKLFSCGKWLKNFQVSKNNKKFCQSCVSTRHIKFGMWVRDIFR